MLKPVDRSKQNTPTEAVKRVSDVNKNQTVMGLAADLQKAL